MKSQIKEIQILKELTTTTITPVNYNNNVEFKTKKQGQTHYEI
ncbi:hypothetical protein DOY81_001570 [Sarcophaga bullata]|nr:hypothetical protein DOY81_001570 [Sarcophaga bullata]